MKTYGPNTETSKFYRLQNDVKELDQLTYYFEARKNLRAASKLADKLEVNYTNESNFKGLQDVRRLREDILLLWQEIENAMQRLF